jgi:hypothetical protein
MTASKSDLRRAASGNAHRWASLNWGDVANMAAAGMTARQAADRIGWIRSDSLRRAASRRGITFAYAPMPLGARARPRPDKKPNPRPELPPVRLFGPLWVGAARHKENDLASHIARLRQRGLSGHAIKTALRLSYAEAQRLKLIDAGAIGDPFGTDPRKAAP